MLFSRWTTIGFERIKSLFERAFGNDTISHAYLFSGPEMIGKRTFALELAGQVFACRSRGDEAIPNSLAQNPDLFYLNPAESVAGGAIGIAGVRAARSFLALSPFVGKYKFAVINDAHLMTEEAQNALLKILEEPGPSSILILVTAGPGSLLPTIVSRCQEIKFPPHSRGVVEGLLKNSKLSADQRQLLGEMAGGKIGLIKDILEKNAFGELKSYIGEFARLAKADFEEKFAFAQKMSDDKNRPLLQKKILYWTLYARARLNEPKVDKILKELLILNQVISQPQYNLRLALENFLLKI